MPDREKIETSFSESDLSVLRLIERTRNIQDAAALAIAKASFDRDETLEKAISDKALAEAEATALQYFMFYGNKKRILPVLGRKARQFTWRYDACNKAQELASPLLFATSEELVQDTEGNMPDMRVATGWEVAVPVTGSHIGTFFDAMRPSGHTPYTRKACGLVLRQVTRDVESTDQVPNQDILSACIYPLWNNEPGLIPEDPEDPFFNEQFHMLRAARVVLGNISS